MADIKPFSPHLHTHASIEGMNWLFVLALAPAAAISIYFNGTDFIIQAAIACTAAVLTELAASSLFHKPLSFLDGNAVITGILLGLLFPLHTPVYAIITAAVFSIGIIKWFFGGNGYYFLNPAAAGFVLIAAIWPEIIKSPGFTVTLDTSPYVFIALVIGSLAGLIILLALRLVKWEILLTFTVSTAIICLITGNFTPFLTVTFPIVLCFLAAESVSTPVYFAGKMIFGALAGCITAAFSIGLNIPESAVFAVFITNLLVPLLDKWTAPRIYGHLKTAQSKRGVKNDK